MKKLASLLTINGLVPTYAGSQQTENHATGYDLVDNPFMRPEATEMIANICSLERMEAVITEFYHSKLQGQTGSTLCSVCCYRKVGIK